MRAQPQEHFLQREQLEQALAMLREELQANPVSPRQRKLFAWFQASFWGFLISVVIFLVLFAQWEIPEGVETLSLAVPSRLTIALIVTVVCWFSLLASLFWNWRLFAQTWRQFRLARNTGLWSLLKTGRSDGGWPRRLAVAASALILAPFVLALLLNPLTGLLILCVPVYLFVYTTRRRLDLIAEAGELEELLSGRARAAASKGTSAIGIPDDAFGKLADIEEAQIQRRRAEAIEEAIEGARDDSQEYTLLRSRAFVTEAARLDAPTQLRVEARVEKLVSDRQPLEARRETAGSEWRIPVPETALELIYAVDEEERRIDLLSIRPMEGDILTPKGSEGFHA